MIRSGLSNRPMADGRSGFADGHLPEGFADGHAPQGFADGHLPY